MMKKKVDTLERCKTRLEREKVEKEELLKQVMELNDELMSKIKKEGNNSNLFKNSNFKLSVSRVLTCSFTSVVQEEETRAGDIKNYYFYCHCHYYYHHRSHFSEKLSFASSEVTTACPRSAKN